MFNDIDIKFIKKNAPCYIYDKSMITERCRVLRNAMPEALFLYSIKTNPFLPVIKTMVLCQEKVQIKHAFFMVGLPCQSFCFFF